MQEPLPPAPAANGDLQSVLAAWHTATIRLEKTHGTLQREVARLTGELEKKNRELARKNRLADLGRIASHIAHEVRNNLVPVTLYMSLLRRRISDDSGSLDILDKVEAGFNALDTTVNDLLHFTSDRDPQWENLRPRQLVEEILASLDPQFAVQQIETIVDVPADLTIHADGVMLRRALLNLVLNALDAMPDGGQLVITSCHDRHGFELEVADSGSGLSPEAKSRAFEPFFTTKPNGTGLGLAIVYRMAEVHGGGVTAANCPEGGAAITIRIPQPAMKAAA